MSDKTKLRLIDELIGCYYEGSYNSQEACEMLIDNIYTILVFNEYARKATGDED